MRILFLTTIKTWYFLPEFMRKLEKQLVEDDLRWKSTWLQRPRKGQEERIAGRIQEYYRDFKVYGKPMPWLKIAGLALIGWIRDNYPELWQEVPDDEIPF